MITPSKLVRVFSLLWIWIGLGYSFVHAEYFSGEYHCSTGIGRTVEGRSFYAGCNSYPYDIEHPIYYFYSNGAYREKNASGSVDVRGTYQVFNSVAVTLTKSSGDREFWYFDDLTHRLIRSETGLPRPGQVAVTLQAGNDGAINPEKGIIGTATFVPPSTGKVTIEIFSYSGQRVKSATIDVTANAAASPTWDGRNDDGNPVPSGTYVLVIQGAGMRARKIITVVK
ncbi:MAG: hypothetical protein HYY63_05320 [Elusimicrobia bacterium]|nr:hypothetical protein [Elusimicrobiota bacterium]